jgi:hypothetical protein
LGILNSILSRIVLIHKENEPPVQADAPGMQGFRKAEQHPNADGRYARSNSRVASQRH